MMVGERSPTAVQEGARIGYLEDEAVCGFWTERGRSSAPALDSATVS